mgnify:CR=1 FL=1
MRPILAVVLIHDSPNRPLIDDLNKAFPDFKYYYMGFYIQNCQKMNYKGKA